MPGVVMCIKIAEDEDVGIVDEVEKRVEIQGVTWRTRRGWRYVDVEDESFHVVEDDRYSLDFDGLVGDEVADDGGEGERVVDKERHPPTPSHGAR